jgi:hypothetical protein
LAIHYIRRVKIYFSLNNKTMNNTKILVAGLIGAVAGLILGFLIYEVALSSFFEGHMASIMRSDEEMVWWAVIVGHLAWGLIFALIYGRWANISTFATGAKAGVIIGGLFALIFDMLYYATTTMMDLTGALMDVIVFAVISAVIGGVAAWWLGRK